MALILLYLVCIGYTIQQNCITDLLDKNKIHPTIIRMTKSRRMRWVGHEVRIGKKRNAYSILVGKPDETTRKTKT
jgi:hypothetical protein